MTGSLRTMEKRKTDRGGITLIVFQNAATDVIKNKFSIKESAKKHSIDKMSLTRYLRKAAEKGPTNANMGYSSPKKILSKEMESDLAMHFLNLCNRFFGLSTDKARSLAWEFAVRNKLDIPVNFKTYSRPHSESLSSWDQILQI